MSPEAATTARVYALLKAEIMGGRFLPRSEIIVAAIAREYGVSIAPVRDSAQRLIGERLIIAIPGGGFAMPDISERGLRDLLFWHGQLIRNAVKMLKGGLLEADPVNWHFETGSPEALARTAASLFHSIAKRAQNEEIAQAVLSAGDRLHAVRLKEPDYLPDLEKELRAVHSLTIGGRDPDLIQIVWAYHRRRLRRARQLVKASGGTVEFRPML